MALDPYIERNAQVLWDNLDKTGKLEWSNEKKSLKVVTNPLLRAVYWIRDLFTNRATEKANQQVYNLVIETDLNGVFSDSKGIQHNYRDLITKMPESKLFKAFHETRGFKPIQEVVQVALNQKDSPAS